VSSIVPSLNQSSIFKFQRLLSYFPPLGLKNKPKGGRKASISRPTNMAILLSIAAFAAAGLLYLFLFVGRRDKRLPPGPPTLPIIGNLHQIPKKG
jgi:hypothetical protein